MFKFHLITAFMKMHANFQKIFLIRVLWFKYIFSIEYKIRSLDLMLLPKTVFHLKGFTTVVFSISLQPCDKLDIKRQSSSILYISASLAISTRILKALPGKLDIKRHSPSIFYISVNLTMSTSILLPCLVSLISKDNHLVFSISQQPCEVNKHSQGLA